MSDCKSDLRLRPHHSLCIAFFEGRGYSEEFVQGMKQSIAMLECDDPLLTLTVGEDMICSACPNNSDHSCRTADKVAEFDRAVLERCGLCEGEMIRWQELKRLAWENIISPCRVEQICTNCQWSEICYKKCREIVR